MGTWVKVKVPIFMGSRTSQVQADLKGTTVGFFENMPVAMVDILFLYLYMFSQFCHHVPWGSLLHNLWNTGCPSFIINISFQVLGQ